MKDFMIKHYKSVSFERLRELERKANEHALLLDALRAFCGDHEATGFECAGLHVAYLRAKEVIGRVDSVPKVVATAVGAR